MSDTKEEDFPTQLKKATRDVHKISDVLVNAKFALALSNDKVWADGLLSFYELYKFFEQELPEELLPKELHRIDGFERDFEYFLGKDWKQSYEIKEPVKKYMDHLREVNERDKILLFAYAFQMYMALMSGGQLLQRKRMIARKLTMSKKEDDEEETVKPGCEATWFGHKKIPELKAKLKSILNEKYKDFDEDMKKAYIEESRNVFIFNNEVIRSVKGVNQVNAIQIFVMLGMVAIGLILKWYLLPK
ncbi:heme oxygenase 1 [Eupeodes corollae]|uniref:heme oxygenase 1 n=1 Tax=Eupeodes corollae TaxID=290404 RepID=UPI00248F9E84|nr:heme oxygenase 1 [Eupeodes corollae]